MPDASTLFNDSAVYRTLLESTKAIPWKIDWATMKFTYIGPQIEALLGWSADSWVSVEDWAMRMHPEDREYVVNYCVSQSQAGQDHEADYRALTKDNGYVWIRDVVHVVRNDKGEAEALIGFMFDITERKKTEEKLLLQKELEVLSFKDGLTNIANRRRFDSSFDLEWERARHERQPLSMLLFDVDYFKQYNGLVWPHPGRRMPGGDRPDAEPGAGRSARSRGALRRRGVCRAAARSRRRGGPQGRRALPAIDREEVHRARAVAARSARHGQHRSRHGGARRADGAGRLHQGRGSAALCGQEERTAPHRACAAGNLSAQAGSRALARPD